MAKDILEKMIDHCKSKGGLVKCPLNDENSSSCEYRGKNVQMDEVTKVPYYECNHPNRYKK